MQHKQFQFGEGFRVALGDRHSQAAQMVLAPGDREGGPDNRPPTYDTGLDVAAGTGSAMANGERIELREGTLVLIQRGDAHEIRNTGRVPLRTVTVYVPPAYSAAGEEL